MTSQPLCYASYYGPFFNQYDGSDNFDVLRLNFIYKHLFHSFSHDANPLEIPETYDIPHRNFPESDIQKPVAFKETSASGNSD